eukprot:gene12889-13015_t
MAADLPAGLSITVNFRQDISDRMVAASAGASDAIYAASASGEHMHGMTSSLNQWVGEVEGAPGPLSTVVLVMGDDDTLHGNIRFYDKKAKKMRAFKIAPVVTRKIHPITKAALRGNSKQQAAFYPEFDSSLHVVVEYRDTKSPTNCGARNAPSMAAGGLVNHTTTQPTESVTAAAAPTSSGAKRRLMQTSSIVRQDLLVVYTAAAALNVGGVEIIQAQIRQTVAMANKAYADSRLSVMLYVVAIRQGCGHNYFPDGPTGGWGPYAFGWRRCDLGDKNFETIMGAGCDQEPGFQGPPTEELMVFASPTLTHPTRGPNVPMGDGSFGHCARAISETSTKIANFRAALGTGQGAIVSTLFKNECVQAPTWTAGVQLNISTCVSQAQQLLEHLSDGSVRFLGRSLCMDVRNGGTTSGTAVQLWTCNGTPAQSWFADYLGRLHPYNAPNMCLTASPSKRLEIRSCAVNNASQVWSAGGLMSPSPAWNPLNRMIKSRLNNMALGACRACPTVNLLQ